MSETPPRGSGSIRKERSAFIVLLLTPPGPSPDDASLGGGISPHFACRRGRFAEARNRRRDGFGEAYLPNVATKEALPRAFFSR
jgi:hypothetical protein